DSYWRIANKYGISIQELQRLNGTSDYFLYPGQSLKVPGSSSNNATASTTVEVAQTPSVPSTPSQPSAPAPSATGTYTVQAGDSYWRIANRHGISIQELQRLNGTNDYFLYPGQVIKVSGTVSAPVVENIAPEVATSVETPAPTTTPASEQAAPIPAATGSTYIAQAGDTLYAIAQRNGLDVYKLIELNGGTTIYIGQTIQLN
ncbi:LysM peptidoglycan-binding domain-containing protein, partial [Aerococcaceae bacterium NML190073]|nr:LysM peptidoglycan-binding domain-containing protein [Aerococcaceae bacterium NML190073]